MCWKRVISTALATILLGGCAGGSIVPKGTALTSDADFQRRYSGALALMKAGKHAEALPTLEALSAAPSPPAEFYVNLGIAYTRADNAARAEQALQKALALQADQPVALTQLAVLRRTAGRFAEAQAFYQQALDAEPDYAYARLNLAVLLDIYLHDPAQALPHYRRYLELTGDADQMALRWAVDAEQRAGR